MSAAYYNEHEPKTAAWLRALIAANLIAPGEVDERSIVDVTAGDLRGFEQCHFFAGIGGWALALELAGWTGPVWTGSCPCQPFSCAGKGRGTADERHLWPEFRRLISVVKPERIFGEQVAQAIGFDWLDGVSADLEAEGYAVGAVVLGAHSVGAPHIRQRLYWVANANGQRQVGIDALLRPEAGGRDAELFFEAAGCSAVGGLGDTSPNGCEVRAHLHAELRGQGSSEGCEPGGLGDTDESGPQGRECGGNGTGQRVVGETGMGAWDRYDILPCRDGKARRVESGIEPLVNGIPCGLVPGSDPGIQEAQATAEARVMRLRGYGNAIVPQVAAEFIKACEEALINVR